MIRVDETAAVVFTPAGAQLRDLEPTEVAS